VKRVHHVGIAVADLDAAIKLYTDTLGGRLERRGRVEGLEFALIDAGGDELELLAPDDAESAIGKFVKERGPGIHHVAYGVDDIHRELDRLRAAGLEQAGDVRTGVHGTPIVFLHPKSVGGVLTELVQE